MLKALIRLLTGWAATGLLILTAPSTSARTGDGIFATFRMRHGSNPAGEFTCRLFYDKAPLAVANFIGLAEGTRPFVDEATGLLVTRPFFDGLTCHRIIKDFMIQGGCPRGNGTSGPGWSFPDEFDPSLRHDTPGRLSMANSGPHTNGSQFFVTVKPTGWLDDKHTIFGEVVDGFEEVVVPLNSVATGANDAPVDPVVIEKVTITRNGAAAQAFDSNAAALPAPAYASAEPEYANAALSLRFPRKPHCSYSLLHSSGLDSWTMVREIVLEGPEPAQDPVNTADWITGTPARRFFRVVELQYPPVLAPATVNGQRITLSAPGITLTEEIGADGSGILVIEPQGGTAFDGGIADTNWIRNPHGGRLIALIDGVSLGQTPVRFFDCGLRFTAEAEGTFVLLVQNSNRQDLDKITGTFSVSSLPP